MGLSGGFYALTPAPELDSLHGVLPLLHQILSHVTRVEYVVVTYKEAFQKLSDDTNAMVDRVNATNATLDELKALVAQLQSGNLSADDQAIVDDIDAKLNSVEPIQPPDVPTVDPNQPPTPGQPPVDPNQPAVAPA